METTEATIGSKKMARNEASKSDGVAAGQGEPKRNVDSSKTLDKRKGPETRKSVGNTVVKVSRPSKASKVIVNPYLHVVSPGRSKVGHRYKHSEVANAKIGRCTEMSERAARCSSFMKCSGCSNEFNTQKTKRFYKCDKEECGVLNEDMFRDDADLMFSVPANTPVQNSCFDVIGKKFSDVYAQLIEEGGPTAESVGKLWEIKQEGIEGNILLKDCYSRVWNEHYGLQDALSNCLIALERQDKIGFRSSFYSLMYMVMVGYGHVTSKKLPVKRET